MRWIRTLRYRRTYRVLVYLAILAALLMLMWLIMRPGAEWLAAPKANGMTLRDRADVLNGARQTLIQAVGVVGVIFTSATYFLSRRSQMAARFNQAATALCSLKIDERIGAIHQMWDLMREAPDMQVAIVSLLAGFVRNNAPLVAEKNPTAHPSDDVVTALTVLADRPPHPREIQRVNLSYTQLSGLELRNARLAKVNLVGAQLIGARLQRIDLSQAWLDDAVLSDANLHGAQLSGASLRGTTMIGTHLQEVFLDGAQVVKAQLRRANFVDAEITDGWLVECDMTDTNLAGADLAGTSLSQSNLRLAEGLSREQVLSAVPYDATLPDRWDQDEQIRSHAQNNQPRMPPPRQD